MLYLASILIIIIMKDFCSEYNRDYHRKNPSMHGKSVTFMEIRGIFFILASITVKIPGHGTRGGTS